MWGGGGLKINFVCVSVKKKFFLISLILSEKALCDILKFCTTILV